MNCAALVGIALFILSGTALSADTIGLDRGQIQKDSGMARPQPKKNPLSLQWDISSWTPASLGFKGYDERTIQTVPTTGPATGRRSPALQLSLYSGVPAEAPTRTAWSVGAGYVGIQTAIRTIEIVWLTAGAEWAHHPLQKTWPAFALHVGADLHPLAAILPRSSIGPEQSAWALGAGARAGFSIDLRALSLRELSWVNSAERWATLVGDHNLAAWGIATGLRYTGL